MSQEDMGLRQYIAELARDEARLSKDLAEVRIAKAHAQRIVKESSTQRVGIPVDHNVVTRVGDEIPEGDFQPYQGLGNEGAIMKLLHDGERRPMSTRQITEALNMGGLESEATNLPATIFGALKRLKRKGKVVKLGEGRGMRWAAPPSVSLPASLLTPTGE